MPSRRPQPSVKVTTHNEKKLNPGAIDEPFYPWPTSDGSIKHGFADNRIRTYFEPFLKLITKTQKRYDWYFFYTNKSSNENFIAENPSILKQLERLFEDELGSKYSTEQRKILLQSQLVVIAVSKGNQSIAGYCASSYMGKNTLPELEIPLTVANHVVVANRHQQYKIGVTMGAITIFHGQKIRDLFARVSCVLRTNNKHLLGLLSQIGNVYRSDHLELGELSTEQQQALTAINYMHYRIYGLEQVSLPFNKPLEIQHTFDASVTVNNLKQNQITYIFCVTTPATSILRLIGRRRRRKP